MNFDLILAILFYGFLVIFIRVPFQGKTPENGKLLLRSSSFLKSATIYHYILSVASRYRKRYDRFVSKVLRRFCQGARNFGRRDVCKIKNKSKLLN